MSSQAYHNKGFWQAYLLIIVLVIVVPKSLIMMSLGEDHRKTFYRMWLEPSNCWETSKHERVCRE